MSIEKDQIKIYQMRNLKGYSILLTFITIMFMEKAVGQCFTKLDKSPHDIVYHRSSKISLPEIKVVYGRPIAKDKMVFGTQIPYGKIWRTGSNEATEIKFYQDIMFGNKFVKAGTYVLYTIPNENYWTIILNKKTDTYGAFFYNPEDDIAKITVPTGNGAMLENFTIAFTAQEYGSQMVLAWAKTRIKVPLYTEASLLSKI